MSGLAVETRCHVDEVEHLPRDGNVLQERRREVRGERHLLGIHGRHLGYDGDLLGDDADGKGHVQVRRNAQAHADILMHDGLEPRQLEPRLIEPRRERQEAVAAVLTRLCREVGANERL